MGQNVATTKQQILGMIFVLEKPGWMGNFAIGDCIGNLSTIDDDYIEDDINIFVVGV